MLGINGILIKRQFTTTWGSNMAKAKRHRTSVDDEAKTEHWMQTKWRPLMAIQYMITCLCDFVIFPILWSLLQAKDHGTVTLPWVPITLASGGFYHLAMGAIVGISAWGRTQEKVSTDSTAAAIAASIPPPLPPVAPSTNTVPQLAQPSL